MTAHLQFQQFLREDSGQDIIEYALLLAFLALGALASTRSLATSIATFFAGVGTTLTSAA